MMRIGTLTLCRQSALRGKGPFARFLQCPASVSFCCEEIKSVQHLDSRFNYRSRKNIFPPTSAISEITKSGCYLADCSGCKSQQTGIAAIRGLVPAQIVDRGAFLEEGNRKKRFEKTFGGTRGKVIIEKQVVRALGSYACPQYLCRLCLS